MFIEINNTQKLERWPIIVKWKNSIKLIANRKLIKKVKTRQIRIK
jgi:hypothetical protein